MKKFVDANKELIDFLKKPGTIRPTKEKDNYILKLNSLPGGKPLQKRRKLKHRDPIVSMPRKNQEAKEHNESVVYT
jgi:hypothetical protein